MPEDNASENNRSADEMITDDDAGAQSDSISTNIDLTDAKDLILQECDGFPKTCPFVKDSLQRAMEAGSAVADALSKAAAAKADADLARVQAETAVRNAAEARAEAEFFKLEADQAAADVAFARAEAARARREADALREDAESEAERRARRTTELARVEAEFAANPRKKVDRVAVVACGRFDMRDQKITKVYVKQRDEYAIYKSGGEVMIQFSDDEGLAKTQRKDILALGTGKADLNALLEGMPEAKRASYDQRMATALHQCLEDDCDDTAKNILAKAYADALLQRSADGRIQYLVWAAICALLGIAVLSQVQYSLLPFNNPADNLWLAGRAGIVGALLSIGIGIRNRTVAIDLYRWSNVAEGALRLTIGMICAGFLLMGLTSGILPEITVGGMRIIGLGMSWQAVLVVGFVAGFLERLVPDLLEKTGPQPPKEIQQTSAPLGGGDKTTQS